MTSDLSLRVLYVEDNPQDADLTRRALQRSAPEIALQVVSSLAAARDALAPDDPPYDLVLSDLALPDGHGLDLLVQIRERDLPLAVVVITGSGNHEDAMRALKAGADDYLVKRAAYLDSLHRVLWDVVRRFRSDRHRKRRALRVLYAEPNPDDLDLTRRHFAEYAPDVHLEGVVDAQEVLRRFEQRPDPAEPPADILLLDYRLPGMTALDLVKELRQVRGEDLPVVLVTGHGSEEIAAEAFKLGIDDYVIKAERYLQQLPALLERVAHQHQLRLSEERYRGMFENQHAVMLMIDGDTGRIVDANPAAEAWYGWNRKELCRMNISDINTLDLEAIAEEVRRAEQRRDYHFHFQHRRADGSIRDVEVFSGPVRMSGRNLIFSIIHDITERRELENQLRQKYKMEAVGMMAGGIAHNFNNNLAIILGSLELLDRLNKTSDTRRDTLLENARTAVLRSRELVQQVLTFSRQGKQRKKVVKLVDIVDETVKLLKSTIPGSVSLVYDAEPSDRPAAIRADSGRIQESLLNLCSNAVQAMDEKGTLHISVKRTTLEKAQLPADYSGDPGGFVQLAVTDSGCGMEPELLERIFDPFFTTKGIDQGTGMGLATVQGIVEQHEGIIRVASRPGSGTTFTLHFPEYLRDTEEEAASAATELPKGNERVLFVDDDEMLADLGRLMLSELGYEVTVACDSRQALQLIRAQPRAFDLLFTDQTMPHLTGRELIREVRKVRPDLPTILCTGYSSRINEADARTLGISAFCLKPLEMPELAAALRTALDSSAT